MLRRFSTLLTFTLILSSCSIYTSTGRKQFESAAPAAIQTFSLLGCREMSAAETWFREEFPRSNFELIEMHPDYEVWGRDLAGGQVEISVITQENNKTTESCLYHFESRNTWLTYKNTFLEELSRSLVSLD